MNKKDLLEKDYFTSNPTFAALLNYFLNDGKNIIKEDDLEELDTNLVLNNPTLSYRQRDIFKKAVMKTDGKKTYLLLGIENQTKDDFYMVIRNMIYDSLSYHNQIGNIEKKNKNDTIKVKKLYPIITIVIYYSHKKWKSPKSLHDLILIEDNNILKYIPDYKLNLIEPYSMEDADFNKLSNDLRLLFEFIKYSGNQDKLDLLLNNNDKHHSYCHNSDHEIF